MTRKDTEKDSERPHYYSQFWLDVAAGRRVIGAPRPTDETEAEDQETVSSNTEQFNEQPIETSHAQNGYSEVSEQTSTIAEPVEDYNEATTEEAEDQEPVEVDDSDIPDVDLSLTDQEEESEDEEFFTDEEEEEEEGEEGQGWGRGRKKAKPARPTRTTGKKPGKRDSRRTF